MLANVVLIFINLVNLVVALLIGEYDISKLRKPDVSWIPTSAAVDLSLGGVILVLSLINLAALVFVVLRHLENHRRWLWWSTVLSVICVAALVIILGKNFLPILWPTL